MRRAPFCEAAFGIFGKLGGDGMFVSESSFVRKANSRSCSSASSACVVCFHRCLQAADRTSRFSTPQSGRTRSYEHVGVPSYSAHNRLHPHAHFKQDYTLMPKRRSTHRQLYICGSIARSPTQEHKARSLSPQQKCACLATALTASTVTSTGSAGLMAQQPAPGSSKSLRKRVRHRERPNQCLQATEDTNPCNPARRLSKT